MTAPISEPHRPRALVISNIAWDFVWQRHQTLAMLLARDYDVTFCEIPGIRKPGVRDAARILARVRQLAVSSVESTPLPAGLRVVRPFVLPSMGLATSALNAHFLRRWLDREPALVEGVDLIVNYSAARAALQLIERVPRRKLVYDCTDDWTAVEGIPAILPVDERALLLLADLTLVPSRRLEELKRPLARRLERLPHGGMVERFLLAAPAPTGSVTLLYYGHLHRQHLDFPLIDELARLRPAWRIVLVGPVRTPHEFPSNVQLAGQQPHTELRGLIATANVLLLPYVINEYTRSVMPAKTYECLATGRPVVATPLPELTEGFTGQFRFASDAAGFATEIEAALAEPPERSAARVALAKQNSWEKRYERLRELIA